MSLGTRNKVSVNFSMASMTDIIFLLLIFFMITSTFVSPNALKVNLPSATGNVNEKATVTVNIMDDFTYAVNAEPVPLDMLESAIVGALGGVEKPGIRLHADKTVPIEYLVNVMDIANKHRLALVLATSPK